MAPRDPWVLAQQVCQDLPPEGVSVSPSLSHLPRSETFIFLLHLAFAVLQLEVPPIPLLLVILQQPAPTPLSFATFTPLSSQRERIAPSLGKSPAISTSLDILAGSQVCIWIFLLAAV